MKLIKYLENLEIYFENNGSDVESIIQQLKMLNKNPGNETEINGNKIKYSRIKSGWVITNTGKIVHTILQALISLKVIDNLWKQNPADLSKDVKQIIPGKLTLEKSNGRDEKDGFDLIYDGESIRIANYEELEKKLNEILEKI